MDTPNKDRCLALLEAMNAGQGQNWEAQWQLYDLLLSRLDDETARKTIEWAVFHCKWRPAVAELREMAAKIASPHPEADEALYEVRELIRHFGQYAAPHPDHPERFPFMCGPGTPLFSHPLVATTVKRIGGYRAICEGECQYQQGGFDGAFRAVYARTAEEWRENVAECLLTGQRPPALFPHYEPFIEGSHGQVAAQQIVMRERLAALNAQREIDAVFSPEPKAALPPPDPMTDTLSISASLAQRLTMPKDGPQ